MLRLMLNDELWSKLRESMLQHRIYDKPNLRMIVEAMLYRMRVGYPWRDLPAEFGCWNSIFQKFNRWSSKGKLMTLFKALIQEPDLEWEFIDGSIVKAHQHSAAASEENQAIGKSRGGNTTKIHMAVDAHGLPIDFEITGGKYTTVKLLQNLSKNCLLQAILLLIKGMTVRTLETLSVYMSCMLKQLVVKNALKISQDNGK